VNAGFGAKVQRVLHFVKGRRDTGFLQSLVDKNEQFHLLARQHPTIPENRLPWRNQYLVQNTNNSYTFYMCSATLNFR
jgi:hypothetical protein